MCQRCPVFWEQSFSHWGEAIRFLPKKVIRAARRYNSFFACWLSGMRSPRCPEGGLVLHIHGIIMPLGRKFPPLGTKTSELAELKVVGMRSKNNLSSLLSAVMGGFSPRYHLWTPGWVSSGCMRDATTPVWFSACTVSWTIEAHSFRVWSHNWLHNSFQKAILLFY